MTDEQIQAEYNKTCAELGHLVFQLEQLPSKKNELVNKLIDLNAVAAERLKKKAEGAKDEK